jgi:hypothetical protein
MARLIRWFGYPNLPVHAKRVPKTKTKTNVNCNAKPSTRNQDENQRTFQGSQAGLAFVMGYPLMLNSEPGERHALRRSRWEHSRCRQGIAALAFGALDGTGCGLIWATDGDGQRERRRAGRTSGLGTGALPRTPGLPPVRAKCWARNRDAIR